MLLIPSLVQDNKADYIKGTEFLEEVLRDGIEVVVSHDPVERIERIIYEKRNLS
jgi:metal dependent hydrolase